MGCGCGEPGSNCIVRAVSGAFFIQTQSEVAFTSKRGRIESSTTTQPSRDAKPSSQCCGIEGGVRIEDEG